MDINDSLESYRRAAARHPSLLGQHPADSSSSEDWEASPPSTSLSPLQLPNKYAQVELLGETRLSLTYQALNTETKVLEVVKQPHPRLMVHAEAIERFRLEVHLAAKLTGKRIVPVLHSHLAEPPYYFTMPYIEGEHLTAYADRQELTRRQRIELFLEVCQGVAYAHERGVLHLDLKPNNILVDRDGEPQLLDFGLGRLHENSDAAEQSQQRITGSLGYMSPEQAARRVADTRSDIYALGVILYELLTRSLPIEFVPDLEVMLERIQHHPPQDPQKLPDPVDRELSAILLMALHKEPGQRYQSVAELIRDVRCYLINEPIQAVRPSLVYLARKWWQRHRIAASLSIIVALAVLIGGGYTFYVVQSNRQKDASLASATHVRHLLTGRWLAQRSSPIAASDLLWDEYFATEGQNTSEARATLYALWDFFRQYPCLWSISCLGADNRPVDVEFTPDGNFIVVLWDDGTVRRIAAEDGAPLDQEQPLASNIQSLTKQPGSGDLYLGTQTGQVLCLQDSDSNSPRVKVLPLDLESSQPIISLAVSENGKSIALTTNTRVIVYTLTDHWRQTWNRTIPMSPTAVALARNGTHLAVAGAPYLGSPSRQGLYVWDLNEDRQIYLDSQALTQNCRGVVFDGLDRLLVAAPLSPVRIDPSTSRTESFSPQSRWGMRSIACSPSTPSIIAYSRGDGSIQWHATQQAEPSSARGYHRLNASESEIAFSPCGNQLVSVASDAIKLWRVIAPGSSATHTQSLSDNYKIEQFSISKDDDPKLAIMTRTQVSLLALFRDEVREKWQFEGLRSIMLSPDGKQLAITDSIDDRATLRLIDLDRPEVIKSYPTPVFLIQEPVWSTRHPGCIFLPAALKSTTGDSVDEGGAYIFSPSSTGNMQFQLIERFASEVAHIDLDEDEQWLAICSTGVRNHHIRAGEPGMVSVYRSTGRSLARQPFDECYKKIIDFDVPWHTWRLAIISANRSRPIIATAGVRRSIYLWDGLSGESLGQLSGHDDAIYTLERFQDDLLVSCSHDKTARIWDIKTRQELCMLFEDPQLVPTLAINDGRVAMYNGTRIQVADVRDILHFIAGNRELEFARYQNRINP
jgi:serine/threonine protein kinase/WD40 repeat protein